MHFRYLNIGVALTQQPFLEILLYIVLAMDQEDLAHSPCILTSKELAQIFVVAVGTHAADAANLGMDFTHHSEYTDFLLTRL